MLGLGSRDAFPGHPWLVPGSSAALTLTRCPSPNICFAFPYSLNYFSPEQWPDSPPCLPKEGNSYLSHLPLEGRSPASQLARAPCPCRWVTALWSLVLLEGKGEFWVWLCLSPHAGLPFPTQSTWATSPIPAWDPQMSHPKGFPTLRAGCQGSQPCRECGGPGGIGKFPRSHD